MGAGSDNVSLSLQNNVVHYCVIQPIYDIAIPPKQYQEQPEEN
jgi:hypothetical protein